MTKIFKHYKITIKLYSLFNFLTLYSAFCYNINMLEQVIQITAIITFIASAIIFFVKIGEYKSLINNEIEILKNDVKECKEDIKNLESEINSMKNNHSQITSLLVEVKTKLELLMAASGLFKNNEKFKN